MNKIIWSRKKGIGANFKVGDRVKQKLGKYGWEGTITAVDKDFQKNIDTGCPFYSVKVKFNDFPQIIDFMTQGLKKI